MCAADIKFLRNLVADESPVDLKCMPSMGRMKLGAGAKNILSSN